MMDIGILVDELIAAGASPSAAARIVAQAYVAGAANADKRSSSAIRQQRYRDRKAERDEASQNVTKRNDVTDDNEYRVTRRNGVTRNADTVSLSPVPPSSPPHPPNNPLTPKPIQKNNSRGTRLPDDWQLTGPDLAYSLSKGLTEAETGDLAERFKSWALSASGPNAVKRNWHQAWQGWVQRDGPKIIAARAGPRSGLAKPLTEFQRKQQETNDVRQMLRNSAAAARGGGTPDRVLPIDHGGRPASVRGGTGGDLLDLSAAPPRQGH